jgi:hypothetical protein
VHDALKNPAEMKDTNTAVVSQFLEADLLIKPA